MSPPTIPKPAPCRVQPDNIPAEMKARVQWVGWRWTHKKATKKRPEKWDKPPIDVRTGRPASSTDSETWSPFDVAYAAYLEPKNHLDGIGYVFSGDEGDFAGVDLDKCRDPVTGEIRTWSDEQRTCKHWDHAAPEPMQLIEQLATYAEVSPSQTGVKLVVRGTIAKGMKHGSVEVYRIGRYFTVTGHRLPGAPAQINECAALGEIFRPFDALRKEVKPRRQAAATVGAVLPDSQTNVVSPTVDQVLAGCQNAANEPKFSRLFDGDIRGYPSQSEAELALCGIVAFWSAGDATLIDQVYRQSKLFRAKWDEARGSQTYGQRTIAAVLEGCTNYYSWGEKEEQQQRPRKEPDRAARGGTIKRLADQICRAKRFAQDAGTKLYVFMNGVYRPKGDEFVRRQVKQLLIDWQLTKVWSPTLADAVVEYVRVDAPQLWERPPLDVINVQNGLLNVETRELVAHSPEHLSSVQLPVSYDPAATCPAIEQFVREVFPIDAIDLAWEIPALLMTPSTSIQKAVLLHGPGGNGKSTYLAMIRAFLGRQNTTAISLHKLELDRFSVARLYGKLANICPDLPSEHLAGTSMFKAITGGDELTGEFKFKDSFEFICFARLVFSANHLPRSQDASQAFFERWEVIPFERSFRGTKCEIPREVLDARLAAPSELAGLLNKCLEALPRLRRNNTFTPSESVERALHEFRQITDPLAIWLDRVTVESPKALVVRHRLRSAFNQHLESLGRPTITDKSFAQEFAKLRPNITSGQRTVSGKPQWCYVGIGFACDFQIGSHHSQDSQGSPHINQSHARELEVGAEQGEKAEKAGARTSRDNPVDPVNPVIAPPIEAADSSVALASKAGVGAQPPECSLLHTKPEQWFRRGGKAFCPSCGKFLGNVRSGE